MPVSKNYTNDIDAVWKNILDCVREIAFLLWDRIIIECVKLLIITVIILFSLF